MGIDWGVLTEAKITAGIHTRFSSGYHVVATEAPSATKGGIALFFRESTAFQVESYRRHGGNVISFMVVTGALRQGVVGCYIPPSDHDLQTLHHLNEAFLRFPPGHTPWVLGDINASLQSPHNEWQAAIATELLGRGLIDALAHFRQRRRFRDLCTWRKCRNGSVISSRCDYILLPDCSALRSAGLRDPRYFSSDHLMVVGEHQGSPHSRGAAYIRGRKAFPLGTPKWGPMTQADFLFEKVLAQVQVPAQPTRFARPPWISDTTWRIVDELHQHNRRRHTPEFSQPAHRELKRKVQQAFANDRKTRTETAGAHIESLLASEQLSEAWKGLQAWYRHNGDRPPKPVREDLEVITVEREALYAKRQPPGEPIPIVLPAPFNVPDGIFDDDEIAAAVRRLPRGKAPGPSQMRAEPVKEWLGNWETAMADEKPISPNHPWIVFRDLLRHVSATGNVPARLAYATCVLLPKPDGGVRGLGLLEICWKVIATILTQRFTHSIEFHDSLHGFRPARGTRTAIIEAKLFQQLAAIDRVPAYEIFLDLHKAYDAVDRGRLLDILEAYGVGPLTRALLLNYWDAQRFVARQAGYYGRPFQLGRGLTQGDPMSPILFNIVCDAIVRAWLKDVLPGSEATTGLGGRIRDFIACFYADDGMVGARDADWLEHSFGVLVGFFARMGLECNTRKTEAMTCLPGYIAQPRSEVAVRRRQEGQGDSFRERRRQRVECELCGVALAQGSLNHHRLRMHGLVTVTDNVGPPSPPVSYAVSFPATLRSRTCPVEGCREKLCNRDSLRRHFVHRHYADTLCILEEGSVPLPKCELCGMHIKQPAPRHRTSQTCRDGQIRRAQREAREMVRQARERVFRVNGVPLQRVDTFKYLGRPLASTDDDWPAIHGNLTKARKRWGMIRRVLVRENANARVSGYFYKAVVQSVVLYGCETWTLDEAKLNTLRGFHNRLTRGIAHKRGIRDPRTGVWTYPPHS
jgi:Reverse transcriptase (RNA-dependent DNA polymerase)